MCASAVGYPTCAFGSVKEALGDHGSTDSIWSVPHGPSAALQGVLVILC